MAVSSLPFPRSMGELPDFTHPPLVSMGLSWIASHTADLSPEFVQRMLSKLGAEWELADKVGLSRNPRSVPLRHGLGDREIELHPQQVDFHWLGEQGERYPHYEAVRDDFVAILDAWSACNPGQRPVAWEVQYVNRIPQGTVWKTPQDWSFFRPLGQTQLTTQPGTMQAFQGTWTYHLPSPGVVLNVHWKPVSLGETLSETPSLMEPILDSIVAIELSFKASGACESTDEFLEGLDAGRVAIVRAFNDLMTPAAKSWWGIKAREK